MTHFTATLASTTMVIGTVFPDQPRTIAVPAAGELPPKGGGAVAESGLILARGLGQDGAKLLFQRDTLAARPCLQPRHRIVVDLPDHHLGHGLLPSSDIITISRDSPASRRRSPAALGQSGRWTRCMSTPPSALGCGNPMSARREPGRPRVSIIGSPAAAMDPRSASMSGDLTATWCSPRPWEATKRAIAP